MDHAAGRGPGCLRAVLAEMRRVLRPAGRRAVTVRDGASPCFPALSGATGRHVGAMAAIVGEVVGAWARYLHGTDPVIPQRPRPITAAAARSRS